MTGAVETIPAINEIAHVRDNVKKWMQDEKVTTPFSIAPAWSRIKWEPLGVALVMSSWNYPLMTSIQPLATAIAAGNAAILKPSEVSHHTSQVLETLVHKYLDNNYYRVIQGGVDVAVAITKANFELIVS